MSEKKSNKKSWYKYIKVIIKNDWGSITLNTLPFAVTLVGCYNIPCLESKPIWIKIILMLILIIVFILLCIRDNAKYYIKTDELQNQLDSTTKELEKVKKAYNDVFEFELIKIYQKLKFGNCERISIYKVEGNNCKVVSRHSIRPEFRSYNKDKIYPLNKGFIGKAWEDNSNEVFITNLPNYKENPNQYITKCLKLCNIEEDTIKQLSMKCRSYYCKVLRNSDETDNIAIIVFESLNKNGFKKENIDSILNEEDKSLATFIQKIVFEVIKSNTDLSKEGF
jgi:hypothetical protein